MLGFQANIQHLWVFSLITLFSCRAVFRCLSNYTIPGGWKFGLIDLIWIWVSMLWCNIWCIWCCSHVHSSSNLTPNSTWWHSDLANQSAMFRAIRGEQHLQVKGSLTSESLWLLLERTDCSMCGFLSTFVGLSFSEFSLKAHRRS